MKLVGYCRVSTENQEKEGTIEIQRQALKAWADNNGHELVAVYEDNGISGAKELEDRPGLAELFAGLEVSKDVKGVLIYKLDRLARDLYVQEHLIRELKKCSVELISLSEPNLGDGDPMRTAFRQFMGIVSQLERSFIAMRLSAGRMKKAKDQGKGYAGGRAAIGYKAKEKDLHVTAAADTVRLIYELRTQGFSLRAIVAELNAQQIPTASGGKWHPGTVKYILDNPVYKGTLHYKGIENNRPDLQIAA